jgi:hypothetical protein
LRRSLTLLALLVLASCFRNVPSEAEIAAVSDCGLGPAMGAPTDNRFVATKCGGLWLFDGDHSELVSPRFITATGWVNDSTVVYAASRGHYSLREEDQLSNAIFVVDLEAGSETKLTPSIPLEFLYETALVALDRHHVLGVAKEPSPYEGVADLVLVDLRDGSVLMLTRTEDVSELYVAASGENVVVGVTSCSGSNRRVCLGDVALARFDPANRSLDLITEPTFTRVTGMQVIGDEVVFGASDLVRAPSGDEFGRNGIWSLALSSAATQATPELLLDAALIAPFVEFSHRTVLAKVITGPFEVSKIVRMPFPP